MTSQKSSTASTSLETARREPARGVPFKLYVAGLLLAVALPLASLYLNRPAMDARRFIAAGVPVAVATDFNPGSAPTFHLPLAMMLACTMNHLRTVQALKAAMINAARAIGLEKEVGSLEAGKRADFVLLDAENVSQWLYHFRANAALGVYVSGKRFQT